jgi:hypothetical protein
MPTHLGGDYLSPFKLAFESRSKRALTERPACFEIDPRGVRSSAPFRMWCRPQLITAINCGSISSSRCQTTRLAGSKIAAKRISVHGRAEPQIARLQAQGFRRKARGTTSRLRERRRPAALHAKKAWWSQTGSNRRPHACKARALPTELWPRLPQRAWKVVGLGRLELPTSRLSSARSNQLSYKPKTIDGPKTGRTSSPNGMKRDTGSSMKKEKRRRRCPANGPDRF